MRPRPPRSVLRFFPTHYNAGQARRRGRRKTPEKRWAGLSIRRQGVRCSCDGAGQAGPRPSAGGSSMAKYAILILEDPTFYANLSPEEWPAVVDAHSKFVEQVFALGGSLAGGEALAPPTTAT